MSGIVKQVLGTKVSVNLNAKKGYRISPGIGKVGMAVREQCGGKRLKGKALRDCFSAAAKSQKKR
jgi:hypothetical protein